MSRVDATLARARGLMSGFTTGQRAVVGVAIVALLMGAYALTQWAAQPTWTPLYSNLSGTDANAIVTQLQAQNVQYQLSDGGQTILVPQSQVYNLRVSLAGKNLPSSGTGGYSILDQQGMTSTDFQQNVAYKRALEGELDKTLQAITGVQTAIVHLAIPKKDVFSTTQDRTTASVLLALQPGTTLTQSQVRSITHLVAGSVEGLDPSDVTVTDGAGNQLSTRQDGAAGAASAASDADQQTAQFEDRMSTTVQQMLDRVLGPGQAVVRVNAQLDYDQVDTTAETYVSPSASVPPLSEATTAESYGNGTSSVGGQLGGSFPTLSPANGASGNGNYVKTQRTVDNAVGKVVSRTVAAPGAVQRMSVAVVLNSTSKAANPAQVQALVANAVGLDTKRGDTVQVSSLPFDTTAAASAAKELAQAQSAAKTASYIDMGKKAGIVLAALVVLFLLRRRKKSDPTIEAYASDLPQGMLGGPGVGAGPVDAIGAGMTPAALTASAEPAALDPNLERDRLRAEVNQLVDSQPDEVAQVIQGWLSERKS